ncbi:MAG: transglutaminaseTgpA domain-containing protein [Thermoanaerobaculia bacterium]
MTFGREKRLLLGWLALVAPIPLPFNEVLEWPTLFVYVFAVVYFLHRADRDPQAWLPNWAMNLLGLGYLPILFVDVQVMFRLNRPFTALLHLIMFLVAVKLYAIRREQDKWHLMLAIFFLFVGSMATSSHVTIAPFLIAFLVIALYALAGLSHLHVLAAVGGGRPEPDGAARPSESESEAASAAASLLDVSGRVSARRPLLAGTLLVVAVAVPLFAVMPRVREPFILGRGGAVGMGRSTGFSDSVDLSLTSTIRSNRAVALRLQYERPIADAADLRFKGATYERYENRNWYRSQNNRVLTWRSDRTFRLASGDESNRATVFLEPLQSSALIVPVETLAVKTDSFRTVERDSGGALILRGLPRREALRYKVALASRPPVADPPASGPESGRSGLDLTGLTPRMRELAVELMGDGTPEERADRIEQALSTRYTYTLNFVGRDGENPLEDFLFVHRSGHCEYFASAMVLLLRSQGIPARFVTGFLGAEFNPLENYYIVRQQNAHAWVEAHTPDRGWRVYDPTPPDGRPEIAEPSLALLATQLWDFITFRWDRYVLTYGAEDQESFFQKIRARLTLVWSHLKDLVQSDEATESDAPVTFESGSGEAEAAAFWRPGTLEIVLLLLLAGAVAGLVIWRRRPLLTGELAYRRLRRRLRSAGLDVDDTLAPFDLERLAGDRYPAAAAALRRLIALYVRESFAGIALGDDERERLRTSLRSVLEVMKAEGRRRASPGSPVSVSA